MQTTYYPSARVQERCTSGSLNICRGLGFSKSLSPALALLSRLYTSQHRNITTGAMVRPSTLKLISTIWEELNESDFPARPPSAPSNIETISLWGLRYPGQKLHPETPHLMSPVGEYSGTTPEPEPSVEPDHPEIWSRVVALCDMLRGLIERLPEPVEEIVIPGSNPNGSITSRQLLTTGECFIRSLEPVRPLLPNKLTESALEKSPELKEHVYTLEHRFDDIERVLRCIPQIFEEVTKEECDCAMIEVEAVMICLGIGLGVD
ncbi:hypothetical protein B0J17DRAFT_765749 [Rhizoctonia solani]|nr:hypothetical protein B0J17DRAFT_765749 [Rhizoctonia solani]